MDENRGLTMREILFRGKWKNSGEWVYGNLFNPDKADTPTQICIGTYIAKTCYEIDPETVGQYTGLTDKNGKKIFEGDIVKLTDDYNDFEWKAVVVFGNPGGAYCWGWNFLPIDGYKGTTDILMWVEMETTGAYCEVIGNIYDNPELLKGGNNNG